LEFIYNCFYIKRRELLLHLYSRKGKRGEKGRKRKGKKRKEKRKGKERKGKRKEKKKRRKRKRREGCVTFIHSQERRKERRKQSKAKQGKLFPWRRAIMQTIQKILIKRTKTKSLEKTKTNEKEKVLKKRKKKDQMAGPS